MGDVYMMLSMEPSWLYAIPAGRLEASKIGRSPG